MITRIMSNPFIYAGFTIRIAVTGRRARRGSALRTPFEGYWMGVSI
jgi:hypothetical protein